MPLWRQDCDAHAQDRGAVWKINEFGNIGGKERTMNQEISELFMYGGLEEDSILGKLGEIFEVIESGNYNKSRVIRDVKEQLKRLLVVATDYGFDKNLWHNYIAFFLMMNENPFSLVCEKSVISEGTVTTIVQEDFVRIRKIFF